MHCRIGFLSLLLFACPLQADDLPLDAQDVLVLRPGGEALRIRLRINVDGQPFRYVWQQYFEGLWKELDRNRNGSLEEKEKLGLPWYAGKGPISKDRYWELCEQHSPPLEIRPGPLRARSASGLFALLDRNGDGAIDAAELAAAPALLDLRDFDDNGVLTQDELLPPFKPGETRGVSVFRLRADGSVPESTQSTFPKLAATFASAPKLSVGGHFWLSIGNSRLPARGEGTGIKVQATGDTIYVDARETKLDVKVNNMTGTRDAGLPPFRILDVDQNNYLDATELKSIVPVEAFPLLDADGDGKVSEVEYRRFVLRRGKLSAATIVLLVTDLGQELFDALDTDHDGRLTRLELQQAAKSLAKYVDPKTGRIGGGSFPRELDWELSRGDVVSRGMASGRQSMRQPPKAKPTAGPEWFRLMDVNGDGMLDRAEFLGSAADFEKLDRNRDGLISADEAGVYKPAAAAATRAR